MATIPATKLRKGMLFKVQNDLFRALEVNHVTPGNLRGFVRVKARNIRSGMLADNKLRSEDMVERATLDERAMQFMYSDGTDYYFMDNESFEQVHIPGDALGESVNYLLPEMVISVEFYGSEPVGIELPQTVDLVVQDTPPAHQGRHGQRAAEARDARDRSRGAGAAVCEPRRQDSDQHGNRRVPGASIAAARILAALELPAGSCQPPATSHSQPRHGRHQQVRQPRLD